MSNNYLKSILNNFPNPIWTAGKNAKCNFFNKAWLKFTGRTMKQEMGDGWAEGVHPDDLDQCVKDYLAAFKNKKTFKLEYRLKHADGTYHWILDFGSPHYDQNNKFIGYIGSCYDTQEVKDTMEKIEKKNKELQKINKYMVDRELKITELKKELATYKKQKK